MSLTRMKIVTAAGPAELPAAFDLSIYTGHPSNADLRGFDAESADHHYQAYGRAEGRISSAIDGRRAFLNLIPPIASLLEIGPFCTPCFSTQTHRVRFLDAFTTTELRELAAALPWGKPELVPEIDYVWRDGPYDELVKDRFGAVFSSHTIEHQPCLVTHLRDVASVLMPGQRLFLIVPDYRYCFDHYLSQSTIADVIDAFVERRRRHTARSILEHRLLLTHNDAERHWQGEHGPDPRLRAADAAVVGHIRDRLASPAAGDAYVDTHAWHFTPESFAHLIGTLKLAGLTPFEVERVYPTLRLANEFFAVLRLPADTGATA